MASRIRLRSSTEADSTVRRPLRWPSAMRTRVSNGRRGPAAGSSVRGPRGHRPGGPRRACRRRVRRITEGDGFIDGAHRETPQPRSLCHPLHRGGVGHPEQRPRVAGAEHPGRHPTLHTSGGLSRRRVLEIWGRDRPIRRARTPPACSRSRRAILVIRHPASSRALGAAVEVLQEAISQGIVLLGDRGDRRDDVLAPRAKRQRRSP